MSLGNIKSAKVILGIFALVVFLLLLSALNIHSYLQPEKVLGVREISVESDVAYWNEFLTQNPDYLPGWVELGRLDKVLEIDPNFEIPDTI